MVEEERKHMFAMIDFEKEMIENEAKGGKKNKKNKKKSGPVFEYKSKERMAIINKH